MLPVLCIQKKDGGDAGDGDDDEGSNTMSVLRSKLDRLAVQIGYAG